MTPAAPSNPARRRNSRRDWPAPSSMSDMYSPLISSVCTLDSRDPRLSPEARAVVLPELTDASTPGVFLAQLTCTEQQVDRHSDMPSALQ
jgi:hypothetical protein